LPRLKPSSGKPVFCIVDPSLSNYVGHHYAYDQSVAAAAEVEGYDTVVLALSEVIPEVADLLNLHRCFRRDIWGRHPLARSLVDAGGFLGVAGRVLDHALCIRDFAADLQAGLAELDLPPGSIILGHMVVTKQLPGFARALRRLPRKGRDTTMVLVLRYQVDLYDNPLAAAAFRRLEKLAAAGWRIRLASDSGRLAIAIGRLTSLPVEVFAIPHAPSITTMRPDCGCPAVRSVRFVSLGNARNEKGILEILEAIRILQAESGGLSGLEFVLQSNNPWPADVEEGLAAFAANLPAEVTLLPTALDTAEYEVTLAAADVVLLPYWRSIYETRSSGVFLDAVAAGKPVIATRDTWMSDELLEHGAGLLVPDHDPRALAVAIREAARDIAALACRAEAERPAVHARHSAVALVRQCAGSAPALPKPQRPPRRLAVFYPWGDFGDRRAGASRRTGLMLDVLAPMVEEVRVLHAGWPPDRREGNVTMVAAPPRLRLDLARRAFRLAVRPLIGRADWGQELALWWHIERRFDPYFRRQVRDLVRWSDAVLIEYSFWAWAVQAECRRQGRRVPCILTAHDMLAEGVTGSAMLRRLTLACEVKALRQADHAVCVSPSDIAALATHGVDATLIPNPVDLEVADAPSPIEARTMLEALFDLLLPPGEICLFVGSDYAPNRAAVARVRALAKAMPPEAQASFVIVGGCAPPGRDGTVLAFGRVDDQVLGALYRIASVVVIPLPFGTGSSLKTVEAMGWGRPILGTSAAFRGLPVTPGVCCEQEDDLSRWPTLLSALLSDSARREAIAAAGRRLAEVYGHRRVFSAYPQLLGIPVGEPAFGKTKARRQRDLRDLRVLVDRAIARDRLDLARGLLTSLDQSQRVSGGGRLGQNPQDG
jgi:glycosyltransferase involved in cell wall biosynthesis